MHPQTAGYVEDNEEVCFGITENSMVERNFSFTEKANKDLAMLASWFPKGDMDNVIRPVYRSEWNYTMEANRINVRAAITLFICRELPIKNFYSRFILGYCVINWFLIKGIGRGIYAHRPGFVYNNEFHIKSLLNKPDLFWWIQTRVMGKNPSEPMPHLQWRMAQQPVFHQYHRAVYRYRWRRPRFVQWDGSMNQPVMPYMHDWGSDVPNGTFRRNCNSDPQTK